ncbi:ATP-binding SpoIIE family protein phosphatase [Streptomyces albidus (ex Kaewkla and Franco 2022)]|uniref:ATP-binding SpoIIE family protein phosphatase n=1 Tax=Streptomyces albidus (ex Kaewkla and Franco 2022) TaxID=722709 RepID=UPI0015EEE173|nr:SpoIIE family protein phosphatase [Streptomyces albidus (ex Kaewkla and Franco 2022)]
MNFTRWSARLPGTQRRTSADRAAQAAAQAQQTSDPAGTADNIERADGAECPESAGSVPAARGNGPVVEANSPAAPAGPDELHSSGTAGPDGSSCPEISLASVGETHSPDGISGVAVPSEDGIPSAHVTRSIDALSVHDLLGQVPALAAVVHGADHRIAYVNDAYTSVFGPRTPGEAAREALPELVELGLLPLMDQVLRSGKPRTVKSRRVSGGAETRAGRDARESRDARDTREQRDAFYTFTCTPITADGENGVLIFAADVTDQVEAAERLRASERRQREAAVTLQRSLLPQELEQPDDLRVAATYQPGGTEAAVGGNWYDVITLGAGRTALVIGDVMGRGVRAAAVMGQLRTAVRAYARLDLPPHEVLQLLDGLAAEIDSSQIATCVYAVHDPNEGLLHYASAGHPPIIVRDADGAVQRAPEPTGPPLGTGGWTHSSCSLPLTPGSSAVLYTDGLVERRDADIDTGIDTLERAFAGATGSPEIICDRLLRSLGITAEHDDDVAVLVMQHPARTGSDAELFHNAALDLLGGTEAAPRARAFASGVLSSWRFPRELQDLGVLAASELVANSLQHGTPPMRLRLRRTDRRLIVEVTDGDDHLPRLRRAELADEAGRGISIVATVASAWGSRRTPGGGKSVWCEFALPLA